MSAYLLTIRIPISAIDHIDAREQSAKIVLPIEKNLPPNMEIKLQELMPKAQPRAVELNFAPFRK